MGEQGEKSKYVRTKNSPPRLLFGLVVGGDMLPYTKQFPRTCVLYMICVVGFVFWNVLFLLLLTLVSITLKQTKLKQRY